MKLSPQLWRQVEPLLDAALAMAPGAREAWLAELDATRSDIAPTLRRLLRAHERAERSGELETVPRLAPVPEWSSPHAAGDRTGPFALVRPLGHGGMGEVWLARQADGRVEREVALKLPALHQPGETWRERFRRERDILASLEHPNIARLYDAGVTADGQPWLAMEFVAGRGLPQAPVPAEPAAIVERLRLFRQVLAAVAHAHRHLVVHRDLKPANILVDASGQVKLLDFGIAKLVDDADDARGDLTRLGGRMMTLRYAAPEQVSGGPITTATDIYALGVILHELLTGAAPYRAVREGRPLTDAQVLAEPAALPSSLATGRMARLLAGDLDAIVLKAMRHDPADRYASAERLDEDILAYLERRPVAARAGTWRYLAGRFAVRHKLPLATAAAVLVTLVAGLGLAERERRVAVAEKARAERHFAGVRRLANTFIFDIHGEIENLAGSLKARQKLVGTAIEYLDRLAEESRDDPALAMEVASAYRRLAEISGDSRGAHLGDPRAARRHAERAAALLEGVEARDPGNIQALREHRIVALLIGRLRLEGGDANGVDGTAKAATIAQRIVVLPDATVADRGNLGATLAEYGGILAVVRDDNTGAMTQLGRAVDGLEALVAANPGDVTARAILAYAYERSATAAEVTGSVDQLPRAIEMIGRSIATTRTVARDDAMNASHSQKLATRHNNAARMKLRAGDIDGARAEGASGRAVVERLLAADAGNMAYVSILAGSLAMASEIELRGGRFDRAMALARESIAADARLPGEMRRGLIVRDNLAGAQRALASSACQLARAKALPRARRAALLDEARALLGEVRAFKQELVARDIDRREATAAIGEVEALIGRCDAIRGTTQAS